MDSSSFWQTTVAQLARVRYPCNLTEHARLDSGFGGLNVEHARSRVGISDTSFLLNFVPGSENWGTRPDVERPRNCLLPGHTHLVPRNETLRYEIRGTDLAWIQEWDSGHTLTVTFSRLYFYGYILIYYVHVPRDEGPLSEC